MPNPQCRDYVELCKFEGWNGTELQTFYKIKEPQDVTANFCQSIVKVCLPIVDNVCRSKAIPGSNEKTLSDDAIQCRDNQGTYNGPVDGQCASGKTTIIKKAQEMLLPNICNNINFYSHNGVGENVEDCCYSPAVDDQANVTCTTPYNELTCTSSNNKKKIKKTKDDSNFVNCTLTTITNLNDLETNPTTIPVWNGALISLPASPTCEQRLKYADNNVAQNIKISGENSDVCYDLSEYTGRVANVVPPMLNNEYGKITYEAYQGFLQNGTNAQPISAIETLSADRTFGNLDYSNKNIITINENGQLSNLPEFTVNKNSTMKMLFVNNVDFNQSFQSSNAHPETQISFNQTQTYKNGEMLKVVLCQEDAGAYADDNSNRKPRYQENYATKCDQYFMQPGNKKEIITKTYNYIASPASLAPNSLTDSDFLTSETSETFSSIVSGRLPNIDVQHQVDSVDITKTAINVYANDNPTNRSPYMFDKNGLLKFMVGDTPIRKKQTETIIPKEPTCSDYDNNVYCHKDFNSVFQNQPSWEVNQLKHDLRFRMAFQIDDLDIKKEFPTTSPQSNPHPSTYYPNSIPNETASSIQKGNQAYQNNTGKYTVTVKVTNPAKKAQLAVMEKLDNIVDKLSLSEMLDFENPLGQEQKDLSSVSTETVSTRDGVFAYLVTNKKLKGIVYYSAILMILLFGFMYLMGLSKLDHQTLLVMILKIAFVFSLFSSDAWMLYYNIFAGPVVAGFNTISYATLQILSPQDLLTTANSGLQELDKTKISTYFYQSVDVITMIFNQKNHFKIMAIFFSYSYGFVYVFIIYYGFYLYLFATANAILMFLLAKIIMLILINLLPLFLLCLFFKTTKKMLDNWFSVVLGYGFQQIFIIIAVAFFNIMIVYILKMILGYKICWDVVLKIPQGSLGRGMPFVDIDIFKFWQVSDGETGDYIPSLFHILYFLILVYAMKHFINFASTLGSNIAGGVSVADLANSIKNDINNNIASKIIRQRFNKLVGGMQNRLIDKISFGYSGKLADDRIEHNNKQIDEERDVFNSLQQKLNDYKSKHKDELLGKGDLEIGQILKEEANKILKEQEYDGTYQDLIDRAKQSKTSTSTTMPGMVANSAWQYGTKYFGKATNAATGNNLVSGLANDSGDISANNLFNANLPRVTKQDIDKKTAKIGEEITKLKAEIAALSDADQQNMQAKEREIERLEVQKITSKTQKNTWDSMNKLRETRDKYGVEAMLVMVLGGIAGGAFGGVAGGATGAVAGLFGGIAGGMSAGANLGNDNYPARRMLGKVLGGLAGFFPGIVSLLPSAIVGAVRGVNRGAVAGVDGAVVVGSTRRAVSGASEEYQFTFSNTAAGIGAVAYGISKFPGAVAYGISKFPGAVGYGIRRSARVAAGTIGALGGAVAGALGGPVVDTYLEEMRVYEANKEYYGRDFAIVLVAPRIVYSPIAFVSRSLFYLPRNTIAGIITGAKAGFTLSGSNIWQDYQQNQAKVINFSSYALNKAIHSYFSAYNIATGNAEYNLQQTLTGHQISKDKQKEIIKNFKEQIRPFLSKKTDLSQLNFGSSGQTYSDPNLQQIHSIIQNAVAEYTSQNDRKMLIYQFIKLAEAEKPVNSIDSIKRIPGSLFSATAGVVLVGIGYGLGSAERGMKKLIQNHREKQAEQAIDKMISSLDSDKESVQAVFTKEFKESLKNTRDTTQTIALIETVIQKVINVTDKVNLKLALEKYAQLLRK